ncbi:histidine phosphatase family protein [Streptomyces piniterrae]|uniref:Histidine phosphatase family protein n=1 Tax=Streptomyces piniterrae TaxID=2571125 RepID=A0A4U0NW03_9ACTN|nr:histidine phosphatase family protein [Streptomyces piniterrae]TJZ58889.1 histidine phosphatase family protein [Streptomyces piniterrae]
MTSRVMLISPAAGLAQREVRFDDDGPLGEAGLRRARAAAGTLPAADRIMVSPSVRCRRTAEGLGLTGETVPTSAPAGCVMGRWRGRTLAEVADTEPEAVSAWLSDPGFTGHGGESLRQLCERVGAWLTGLAAESGRVLAVVEPDVVRAATVCALQVPAEAFWRLDVAPLTAVELSGRSGRWNLGLGRPLGGS